MILGLTGTFAAGKDAAAEYLKEKGFFHTSLSDLVREECVRQNRPIDRDTCRIIANETRAKFGAGYFTKLAMQKIKNSSAPNALVVSIRNLGEVEELKKNPNFKLLAIDAPIKLRYERAIARKSEKDKVPFETFEAQENEEMTSQKSNEMQIGTILKMADFTIQNIGTLEELYEKIDEILASKPNRTRIKIKRVDRSLPMPKYETGGSVAFDLYSRIDEAINPKELKIIPANFIISAPPEGYFLMLASRSSLPLKKGLMIANGVGIFDHDYCGPEDEYRIQVYNFSEKPVEIKRGERLAQLMLIKFEKAEISEIQEITAPTRGGFGSTGGYINGI